MLVLVRTGPRGEWRVAAKARPDESGAWTVADLAVPPEVGPTVEVRAVLSVPSGRVYSERESEAGVASALPASRVVRVAAEAPAVETAP